MSVTTGKPSRRCAHTKADGHQCGLPPLHGSEYCFWHDPDNAKARREARSKGGKARHGRTVRHIPSEDGEIALQTAGDVLDVLEHEINSIRTLEPGHRRARTIGYLCGLALKALEVAEHETMLAEHERQIAELHSMVNQAKEGAHNGRY